MNFYTLIAVHNGWYLPPSLYRVAQECGHPCLSTPSAPAHDAKGEEVNLMIALNHVSFRYKKGADWGFQRLSFRIPSSASILGPSGAGKSTLLKLLAGYLTPRMGNISIWGVDPISHPLQARHRVAYVPQENQLPLELTLREYLTELAHLDGWGVQTRDKVMQTIAFVHLESAIKQRLKHFSGGMKRRALVAGALLRPCPVLLIDEPTAGLDPDEQATLLTLLRELSHTHQVVMATQVVTDALALPNQWLVLDQGQLVTDTTPQHLLDETLGHVFALQPQDVQTILTTSRLWMPMADGHTVKVIGEQLDLSGQPGNPVEPLAPTVEDAYLWLMERLRRSQVDVTMAEPSVPANRSHG